MAQRKTSDDYTREMLDRIRDIQYSSKVITEAEEKEDKVKQRAIAITDDPKFGNRALSTQMEQFKSSVESGTQFAKPSDNVADSPLIYMPDTGNLVFSGTIPCLNNLKWQFVLKTSTGNGCFIWSDGMILNKDNIQILNKLYGFYCNWKNQWEMESADLERMAQNILNNQ